MTFRWAIPCVLLIEVLDRLVDERRALITDPLVSAGEKRALIRYGNPTGTREPDAEGWQLISNLIDDFAGARFLVEYNESTGGVRLVDPEAGQGS